MYVQRTLLALLLLGSALLGLNFYAPQAEEDLHGLYVNDFKHILGYPDRENQLLAFARDEGFNYLLLYNVNHLHRHRFDLTTARGARVLARFIRRAKQDYDIREVGVVGETARTFDVIQAYNRRYAGSLYHRVDAYNLEFECWNAKLVDSYYCETYLERYGYACDQAGAFAFYLDQLKAIRQKTLALQLKCETYIGRPTPEQCAQIGQVCDRVLVHYYRQSDVYQNGNSIYRYQDYRLPALAPERGRLLILPIFSARDQHMGPWLDSHSRAEAYHTYHWGQEGYRAQQAEWQDHLLIQGDQWYRYTDLIERQ
ncbi:MAG: hypothetical protein AAFW73_04740 [Bacteroidota bacterium]